MWINGSERATDTTNNETMYLWGIYRSSAGHLFCRVLQHQQYRFPQRTFIAERSVSLKEVRTDGWLSWCSIYCHNNKVWKHQCNAERHCSHRVPWSWCDSCTDSFRELIRLMSHTERGNAPCQPLRRRKHIPAVCFSKYRSSRRNQTNYQRCLCCFNIYSWSAWKLPADTSAVCSSGQKETQLDRKTPMTDG